MKIGFIGIGNMGSAMLKGASTALDKTNLTYTDINKDLMEEIKAETGIPYTADNHSLTKSVDIIVLAVKPQYLKAVMEDIRSYVKPTQIIISIAPGITIDHIKNTLGEKTRVVRSMPNTPALVLEGMTGYCFSHDAYSQAEMDFIRTFFESFGRGVELTEHQLDMVVPISGSSPAYGFMMIEAMADAGVLIGLPRQISYELAAQSMLGAAKMVLETKTHPAALKDAVCSPGGTTIEAVRVLEKNGFKSSIIEAMVACYDKTKTFK
ncbi:pyrroline-5-carboxylate reductase [Petrocella sp. FN5]|uniref:pyrroline-5-carboxylate reductase n=1 Tax=Petrocella sp. FN5 TaxID=3032002 RepID=UPI0023DC7736|nr:pyrroline-5-carboxylate reductase [Petrocella sp. FN5]MDF1616974.1 pyrroline-5-carboxylate reductase [Petrocella sp. FN5]